MSKKLTGYEEVGRLFRLLGWLCLICGVFFGFFLFTEEEVRLDEIIVVVALFFAFSILYLPLGKAIKEHRPWGRIVGNIVGVAALFGFPIGIGIYILILLNKSWNEQPRVHFVDQTQQATQDLWTVRIYSKWRPIKFREETMTIEQLRREIAEGRISMKTTYGCPPSGNEFKPVKEFIEVRE